MLRYMTNSFRHFLIFIFLISAPIAGYISGLGDPSGLAGAFGVFVGIVGSIFIGLVGLFISFFARGKPNAKQLSLLAYALPTAIVWLFLFTTY